MQTSSSQSFRARELLSVELAAPIVALQRELSERSLTATERAYFSRFLKLDLTEGVSAPQVHDSLRGRFRHLGANQEMIDQCTSIHIIAEMNPPLALSATLKLVDALRACHLERYFDLPRNEATKRATPLYLAVASGNASLALQFLRNGADPRFSSGALSVMALAELRNDEILVGAFNARIKELDRVDEKKQVAEVLRAGVFAGARFPQPRQSAGEVQPEMRKLRDLLQRYKSITNTGGAAAGELNDLRREIWNEVVVLRPSSQALKKVIDFAGLGLAHSPIGLSILGEALSRGDAALARTLHQFGVKEISLRAQSTYTLPDRAGEVTEEQLTDEVMSRLNDFLPSPFVREALNYFSEVPSTFQLYLYFLAREEMEDSSINAGGLSFFQVASNVLYIPMERRNVSELMDLAPKGPDIAGHPYESDILLLLNDSPEATTKSQEGLKFMTRYLRLPEGVGHSASPASLFQVREAPEINRSPASRHWMLSRIGSLGYSFSRLRFDAMSAKVREDDGSEKLLSSGLIAEFGGEYISNAAANQRAVLKRFGPQPYGAQFFFEPESIEGKYQFYSPRERSQVPQTSALDDKTAISLRQGYYLVSNPHLGTLIIRNSSPEFGRFLLADAALYLNSAVTQNLGREDLLYPSARLLKLGKNPVLIGQINEIQHINKLIDELQGALQLYREWKFNTSVTSAWDDLFGTGRRELIGGHLSPGFEPFVKHLGHLDRYFRDSPDVSLALAFVHPDFPSWRQYPFQAEDGSMRRLLAVDERVLECLEHLACGDGDERELQETGVRNFMQQAGLAKQSELLVVSF